MGKDFIPVCSIVELLTRGAVDDLMHYFIRPSYNTLDKKVKQNSENHGTKEHQNKQLFICLDTYIGWKKCFL